jgi:Tfp pilus assembly protein FimT
MELLAVLAILTLVGGVIAPTLGLIGGDTRQKAGVDAVQARLADARAAAIEQGRVYRVSVSEDGTRVRVAPDDDQTEQQADNPDDARPFVFEDPLPEKITALPVQGDETQMVADQSGWVRLATFLPDGTCREDSVLIEVREDGGRPMTLRLRGLTGSVSVSTEPAGGNSP